MGNFQKYMRKHIKKHGKTTLKVWIYLCLWAHACNGPNGPLGNANVHVHVYVSITTTLSYHFLNSNIIYFPLFCDCLNTFSIYRHSDIDFFIYFCYISIYLVNFVYFYIYMYIYLLISLFIYLFVLFIY